MEDKELCGHTYGVRKPRLISRVSPSNVERRMGIFLNRELKDRNGAPIVIRTWHMDTETKSISRLQFISTGAICSSIPTHTMER